MAFNLGIARAFQAFGSWKERNPAGTYDQWVSGLSSDAVRAIEDEINAGDRHRAIIDGLEWYARGRDGYEVTVEDRDAGIRWACRRVPENPDREFNFHNYMRSMGTMRPPVEENAR